MKSSTWLYVIIGGFILYTLYKGSQNAAMIATGTDPTLPPGPTSYPDPVTSVQAGGAGGSVQSLALASMYGTAFNG